MNTGRSTSPVPAQQAHWSRRLALLILAVFAAVAFVTLSGPVFTRPSQALTVPRKFNAADIQVANGYHIEGVASNLTAPSAAVFDGQDLLVAESGVAGNSSPRILRIKPDGSSSVIANHSLRSPVTGLLLVNGNLFVSHRGKISVLDRTGKLHDVVTGLPSEGDNTNNALALGPDGKIYFGQGTITNAGVVGLDSAALGWLDQHPELHDIPCQDVTTLGQNYRTSNPSKPDPNSMVLTGAFQPFGSPGMPDEIIKGDLKCSGSILRFNPDGSNLELVAWGLHNPVGLAFDGSGQLWATNQGVGARGSRVIANDPDELVRVEKGAWYGWPDFFEGQPATADRFKTLGQPTPGLVWDEHPPLTPTFLGLGQVGVGGLAFSPGAPFGFEGDALVALSGLSSADNATAGPAGVRVSRVNPKTREVIDVAVNRVPGPASANGQAGLERPAYLVFGPDHSLYVVDMGTRQPSAKGFSVTPFTGAVWRIYAQNQQALVPGGPRPVLPQNKSASSENEPVIIDVPFLYSLLVPWGIILGGLIGLTLVGAFLWQWTHEA